MKIGILGTGRVASAVGAGWVAAGHDVVLGSRTPEEKRGSGLPVVALRDAAAHGPTVVNATSGRASLDVLTQIGAPMLAGKILVDIALAVTPERELVYPNSSLGERIQERFPDARVVKTLSSVPATLMRNTDALSGPITVFLSGDDSEAKHTVAQLLGDLGWSRGQQIDLGGIVTARGPEHLVPLLLGVFGALGTTDATVSIVHRI